MRKFLPQILIFSVVLTAVFVGAVTYSISVGPKMAKAAQPVLDEFLVRSRAKNYAGARELFSETFQSGLGVEGLAKKWAPFETKHGAIKSWKPSLSGISGGNLVNLFPPSVDFTQRVEGQKNGSGLVLIRMVPQNGTWRIDKLIVLL